MRSAMTTRVETPVPELRARFEGAGGNPASVGRMFGRIAAVYDLMNRLMTGGLDRRWRAFAARRVGLGPGERALDVGPGTGDLGRAVSQAAAPTTEIIGGDVPPRGLA